MRTVTGPQLRVVALRKAHEHALAPPPSQPYIHLRALAPSEREGEMVNLGNIEQKLNHDPAYRQAFLRDPVAALAREGISVSTEIQGRLRQQVKEAVSRGKAKLRFGLGVNPCV
jgi:hypothetical protein